MAAKTRYFIWKPGTILTGVLATALLSSCGVRTEIDLDPTIAASLQPETHTEKALPPTETAILRPGIEFENVRQLLESHGAKPTVLQVSGRENPEFNRTEVFRLKDGRVIDFKLTRKNQSSPWNIEGIFLVVWTEPNVSRAKKWIPMEELKLGES